MTLDVQSEVKAGRLNQFVWVRVLGLMVKRPVLTDEVKSILRKHGLHQPHRASATAFVHPDGLKTCARCARNCRAFECTANASDDGAGSSSS